VVRYRGRFPLSDTSPASRILNPHSPPPDSSCADVRQATGQRERAFHGIPIPDVYLIAEAYGYLTFPEIQPAIIWKAPGLTQPFLQAGSSWTFQKGRLAEARVGAQGLFIWNRWCIPRGTCKKGEKARGTKWQS
jgi:hypothetical protein